MNVTLPIPDDLAQRLSAGGSDLARQALEAFALEAYRAGRLTGLELRRLLGFGTSGELDGFLKARGLLEDTTPADLAQEQRDLDGLATGATDSVVRIHAFRRGKMLGGLDPVVLIREGRR